MADLPVKGQGIFVFKTKTNFSLFNADESDGLIISNENNRTIVQRIFSARLLVDETCVSESTWFSLDAQNQCLYAGIGEARIETVVYKYQFENTLSKIFLERIVKISCKPEKIIKDPITTSIPLLVKSTCTMDEIAHNKYMPKSHLSLASQRLYDCIYKTTLNTTDFKDFAKAIDHSINTPGCWCHEKLKEKASEFGNTQI